MAVKVQRPRSLRRVAVDMFALRRVLELLRAVVGFKADVAVIADEVRHHCHLLARIGLRAHRCCE